MIDKNTIANIIDNLKNASDAGPSGINAMHLKDLANQRNNFNSLIILLVKKLLSNQITTNSKCKIPKLYEYKLILA